MQRILWIRVQRIPFITDIKDKKDTIYAKDTLDKSTKRTVITDKKDIKGTIYGYFG